MAKMDIVEKPPKVEASPPVEEPQLLEVTLDIPIERVIECDKKGWKITFDETPGKFKRLSEKELDQLHRLTQASYLVSERYHQSALEAASNPRGILTDIRQDSRATDRLEVRNKDPEKAYSWKRPDEIRKAVGYEGWKVETDPKLETFRKPVGGAYRVGALGEDELVLVSRPKALHEAHLREAVEKSNRMRGSLEKNVAEGDGAFFQEGDTRLDPKGKQWRDVDPSAER